MLVGSWVFKICCKVLVFAQNTQKRLNLKLAITETEIKLDSFILQGYLRYNTIISQNVLSEAHIKNFFYFVEKLCFVLKIFKFLYF